MDHLAHCPNCRLSFSPNMHTCPYCARVFCHCSHCGSTDFTLIDQDTKTYRCHTCGETFTYPY